MIEAGWRDETITGTTWIMKYFNDFIQKGFSGKIVFFKNFKILWPVPCQHMAAIIGCTANVQTIGATVHWDLLLSYMQGMGYNELELKIRLMSIYINAKKWINGVSTV